MTAIPELAERLRELDAKATPGPWHVSGVRYKMSDGEWHSIGRYDEAKKQDENLAAVSYDTRTGVGLADAHLIADLRTHLPEIISSLEELSRLKAGEGWRDMQSAPRDGSMFLMGYVGHPEWGTKVCMRKVQHLRTDAGFEVKDLGSWALVNGIDDDLAETDSTSGNPEWSTAPDAYNDMATWHWRPLPPAPGGRSDG